MAAKTHEPSLWDSLPKAEQERIKKILEATKAPDNGKAAKKPKSFELKGYVRCDLSRADKDAFVEWETNHSDEECYGRLIKLADSGYLLKVGEQGQSCQASLCAATTGHAWDGYVLTAHAGNASRAVMLLVYKHETLLASDWSQNMAEDGEDFFR